MPLINKDHFCRHIKQKFQKHKQMRITTIKVLIMQDLTLRIYKSDRQQVIPTRINLASPLLILYPIICINHANNDLSV